MIEQNFVKNTKETLDKKDKIKDSKTLEAD